jgi:hypothetical protein
MISVGFWPKGDGGEIPGGLSLSKTCGKTILALIGERKIADVSATL